MGQETFRDNFSSVSYSNNNGTMNFSSAWDEDNDDNSPYGGRIDINSNQLRFQNLDGARISRTLDLNGASTVTLTLDYNRTSGNESIDVQLWNGSYFNTVATLSGSGSVNYTLATNEISNTSEIRFESASGNWSGSETIYVDNIHFTATFLPILNVDDITVNEFDGSATFTVSHTGAAASGPFTVNYILTDGTASAGSDYTDVSGTLYFNGSAGDTEQVVVPILDDGQYEGDEIFELSFTGASDGSVIVSDTATATILNDDGLVMVDGVTASSCNDIFVDPGANVDYSDNLDVVYTICPDTANNYVSIDFTNFDVASNDMLYVYDGTTTGGALIGQYNNANVPDILEPTGSSGCLTFRFVSNWYGTGAGWEAAVSCYPEGPKIVINDISFDEDVGNAVFTVTQTRARHGFNTILGFIHVPFTVSYQTADGSALAGSDYTTVSGTLNFNGQLGSTRTISVPIANDGIPEISEDFQIVFTGANASYGTINYGDTGTGTIQSQILANDPLTLFQEFDGYYDYSTTGGTLRTGANGSSPCTITTTSSNTLISPIPGTATIAKAYLYWAHSNSTRDDTVTFEGQSVSANYLYQTTLTNRDFYGYVSDVTSIIQGISNPSTNTYDFSGLSIDNTGNYCSTSTVLGGWTLIVFYEDPSLPAVNINLYQGFDGLSNEGTSFTLDSFFAIAGSGAKATFLSWEGDPDLDGSSGGSTNPEELSITSQGGTTYVLTGDGGQTGNNSYNSTIYDNTVAPLYNNSATYGVDLDTYDISSYISPSDTQVTANVDVGQDFVISAAVVIKVPSNLITGTVFEDHNYPGGVGRNQASSGGLGTAGAIVELFDSGGNFIERNTTDINGDYSFGGMADGSYYMKVVNNTVKSNRAGGLNCSECFPVQTFRSYGSAASILEVISEIGGADPSAFQDAALGVLTGAQSVSAVSVSGNGVVGIDFGFNFNTIVNTNNNGQGSLEQFILNSNALDASGIDILANGLFDPGAGEDVSIFMIPPTGDPLGRPADPNYNGMVFDINIPNSTPLSVITDDGTHLDGRTQTAYSGNTNAGSVGSGGVAVGVAATVLPVYARPEIQLHHDNGNVLQLQGNDLVVRNIAVFSNANAGLRIIDGDSFLLENLIGVDAVGNNSGSIDYGIELINGSLEAQGNYISTASEAGIFIQGGSGALIQNNHITMNGANACGDNILLGGGSGIQILQNLIELSAGLGIDGNGIAGAIIIAENSITGAGQNGGTCSGELENAGILLDGNNSSVTGNIIYGNGGAGVVLAGGNTSGNLISRNSIYANGTATDALGIDIDLADGMGDGVTLNDNGDTDSGPNSAVNFPIISAAYKSGSNLVIKGWARPGATIEVFLTDVNEGTAVLGDNQLGMAVDYGEGQSYLATVIEGSGADLDSGSATYTDGDGNTDNTNQYMFEIPVPAGVVVGSRLTATCTLANSTSEFSPFSIVRIRTVITNRRITYRVSSN
jgi:hypothetical protein